jgi:hypothetical protein
VIESRQASERLYYFSAQGDRERFANSDISTSKGLRFKTGAWLALEAL